MRFEDAIMLMPFLHLYPMKTIHRRMGILLSVSC